MHKTNRTKIGIKSSVVIVAEALIIGVLTMLRTRFILLDFGTNVNGVLQLATQLSSYMLLFESGMTSAYQFNMYKPLLNEDYGSVSRLYTGMRHNLKIIAAKMFFCSAVIAFGYSIILQKRGVSYGTAAAILTVMGARLVCPYVFTISLRTLLIVKERKYLTDIIECVKNALSLIIEIILIKTTDLPLYAVLSVYIFLTFLSRFMYVGFVKKLYGESINGTAEKNLAPKKMTADILVHRIAGVITDNTDTVLLSIVKKYGLNSVTIYTSFYTIISYPITLVTRMIDSMRASLALKITEKPLNSYAHYREILSFSKLTVMIVLPVYIAKSNDFVELWIGKEFQLDTVSLVLMSLVAMHKLMIPTVYAARDAKGLYKESKGVAIVQAIVNMAVSVALIKPLGIKGILIGTVVSDWIFLHPFNIKLVFTKVFERKFDMTMDYALLLPYILLISFLSRCINNAFFLNRSGWINFIVSSAVISAIVAVAAFASLYLTDAFFRKLVKRFMNIKKS